MILKIHYFQKKYVNNNKTFSGLFNNNNFENLNNTNLTLNKDLSFVNNIQDINPGSNNVSKNILENSFSFFNINTNDAFILNQNNDNNRDLNNQNNESPKDNKHEKEDNICEVIKISEELDKPNELNKDSTDNDYIKIINDKMKKYKRELTKSTKSNTIKKNKLNKKKIQ